MVRVPTGFDDEMHSAAGGTTGRSASGQGCNLVYLIENNRRNGAAAPDDALRLDPQEEAASEVVEPTPLQGATTPRLATYYVLAYGDISNPLRLGTFDLLPDGHYRAYVNGGASAGEGRYGYDKAEGSIHWLSGPYEEFESSAFSIIRRAKPTESSSTAPLSGLTMHPSSVQVTPSSEHASPQCIPAASETADLGVLITRRQ